MARALRIIGNVQGSAAACSSGIVHAEQATEQASVQPQRAAFQGRVALVTLGCAKNKVDSEVMLGGLVSVGFEVVPDPAKADVIVVNTCGFLQSAVEEGIDVILELSEFKQNGRCRQLIVAGCMVKRYRSELEVELPEVDHFVSVDEISDVAKLASNRMREVLRDAGRPYFLYDDSMPRCVSTPQHMAYVKIAEGCNRPCTFCIIPKIRGAMRSREIDSIVREVQELAASGVREVNLLAQDLTSFGTDRTSAGNRREGLADLLHALDRSAAVDWIRLLYAYPVGIDQELLTAIRDLPSVVNYLDVPLQHADLSVLRAMQRPLGKLSPRALVESIRLQYPEIALRTTFIVGFPGETEDSVVELEEFIAEGHFSSVGVFTYSPEVGTPAYDMPGQVAANEKQLRYERLMQAQQRVVSARNDSMLGSKHKVLVEGTHTDTELLLAGRAEFQAPEVDSCVIINEIDEGLPQPSAGDFVTVQISDVAGYDLVARMIAN